MSLKDLTIQDEYRSDRSNLIQDFYIPSLENSNLYQRAVGFFSSTSIAVAAQGITALIRTGGKMQLIASPRLSQEDVNAIATGLKQREEIIVKVIQQELIGEFNEIVRDRLSCLAWLIAHEILEIKLAIAKEIRKYGIYHEKLGIFKDDCNVIAFTGSVNESSTGLINNFECIDVFCSWHLGVQERALRKAENFQKLWENQTENLDIVSFPEASKRSLLQLCPKHPPTEYGMTPQKNSYSVSEQKGSYHVDKSERKIQQETLEIPEEIVLRQHQIQAIKEWFSHSGKGILEMATGSGKTITALAIATKLYEHIGSPLIIVIVCPYLHLVNQWIVQAKRFGLDPLPCNISRDRWERALSVRLYNAKTKRRALVSIITSNTTFASEAFQHQLQKISPRFLLIADEVHNLGSEQLQKSLPKNASYRLGLSATPERWFDETGTNALLHYFSSTLVHYTLRDALGDKVLCPYRYYPQLIELTEDEFQRYYELTKKIARVLGTQRNIPDSEEISIEALLIQRSRLIATARQKIEILRSLLSSRTESMYNLIYCGDGTLETDTAVERQIDAVTRLLGHDLNMKVAQYTSDTPLNRRDELRDQFARGEIQALVAIRCLDEGVDIPETQRAFILASSSNPRQFIQRRGRLLRLSPGKTMAEIFDFIVKPPDEFTNSRSPYYGLTRRLFGKELLRVLEFAELAENRIDALYTLLDLRDRLNLLDLGVE
ncbi:MULTISPECIES: DEAD/DEAH box helicase family protein [Spirulina sp. CCY15215]|uniref:DEAD/DEAH box helicase family protein n=1 Tax=Spirulina sp. CCY15215 TaxID=2767591 RepID=UPI00194E5F5D|nr:DEAD/DEAH box helicase family protein [Spirulina major]